MKEEARAKIDFPKTQSVGNDTKRGCTFFLKPNDAGKLKDVLYFYFENV
jgi:hypothetical protein